MNTTRSLINRAAIRDFTMATLASERPHLVEKFTRVSASYYTTLEAELRQAIVRSVRTTATAGKTIR